MKPKPIANHDWSDPIYESLDGCGNANGFNAGNSRKSRENRIAALLDGRAADRIKRRELQFRRDLGNHIGFDAGDAFNARPAAPRNLRQWFGHSRTAIPG